VTVAYEGRYTFASVVKNLHTSPLVEALAPKLEARTSWGTRALAISWLSAIISILLLLNNKKNAELTISLGEYPEFLEFYRILSSVQINITKRIIKRLSPYLILLDKIIQDLERKMDKAKGDDEENMDDMNNHEGFMKNDKDSKKKKKKDFVGELKNELWSGVIKLDDCEIDTMESFDLKTVLLEFMADPPENHVNEKIPYKFIYDPEEAYQHIMFDSIEDHTPS
jgi:hypothetical protein